MQNRIPYTLILIMPLLLTGCSVIDQTKDLWNSIGVDVESSAEQHTVLVPGYGAPVAGNPEYEGYIQQVADFVNDEANGVDAVVFTGGYSSLEHTSEAESMNSYFNSIVDTDALVARGVRVYKEECAIVSWQNITYSEDMLTDAGISPDTLIVFGDVNREDKLKTFASFVFNQDIDTPDSAQELITEGVNYTTIDFHGYDFGGAVQSEAERNALFAAEIAGAYDPIIGNQILEQRINDWIEDFGYDVADNLVEKGCEQYEGFR